MVHLFIPPFPQSMVTSGLFTVCTVLYFPECHMVGHICYVTLRLASFHLVTCI